MSQFEKSGGMSKSEQTANGCTVTVLLLAKSSKPEEAHDDFSSGEISPQT
jgi:hypothetical protein